MSAISLREVVIARVRCRCVFDVVEVVEVCLREIREGVCLSVSNER